MSQESTSSENTVQDQLEINPKQKDENLSDDGESFNNFKKIREKETEHPKNCFCNMLQQNKLEMKFSRIQQVIMKSQ